ncbi:helix-turn-helix domain-containing protein [Sporolactobacillus sp. THM19-2]|nr:helix-turn-helix domain-containing protein [Sporolactobacillus sp. THM19-2]
MTTDEGEPFTTQSTALHFNISSPFTIYQWDRRFETRGCGWTKK